MVRTHHHVNIYPTGILPIALLILLLRKVTISPDFLASADYGVLQYMLILRSIVLGLLLFASGEVVGLTSPSAILTKFLPRCPIQPLKHMQDKTCVLRHAFVASVALPTVRAKVSRPHPPSRASSATSASQEFGDADAPSALCRPCA